MNISICWCREIELFVSNFFAIISILSSLIVLTNKKGTYLFWEQVCRIDIFDVIATTDYLVDFLCRGS